MNLLDTPLISTLTTTASANVRRTLPGILAALVRDEIGDFPRLRPHQRHVWHAFLVQVAALATLKNDPTAPPDEEEAWRERLLALTPKDPDGAAWALVSPPERPALLQPPIPGGLGAGFKTVETPDALDMLVMSRHHDLKTGAMTDAEPEHWLYALVSLQTQEGFLGAGNYGISRMNGGFASRPGLGIEPGGGPGRRFVRDLRRLHAARGDIIREYSYPATDGDGLVWLLPWDGNESLRPERLDPFYIEICRRVRLAAALPKAPDGRLVAWCTGSKAARIDVKSMKGRTGDPWTPLVSDKEGSKALTVDADGFSYRRLVPLLFTRNGPIRPAELQTTDADDDGAGLSILARALTRGQGKTEGFHERRIPVSKAMRNGFRRGMSDQAASCAHDRLGQVSLFAKKVMFPAALAVVTGAPRSEKGERKRDDDNALNRARRVGDAFDRWVDDGFFDALEQELAVIDDGDACRLVRGEWILDLRRMGKDVLEHAIDAAPHAAVRDWRVRVNARELFEACFKNTFKDMIPEKPLPPSTANPDDEVIP